MEFAEAIARLQQLARERTSLEAFYADLIAEAEARAEVSVQGEPTERLPAEVVALIVKLINAINMEREQWTALCELLMDAYRRLGGLYDFELPPEFPTGD